MGKILVVTHSVEMSKVAQKQFNEIGIDVIVKSINQLKRGVDALNHIGVTLYSGAKIDLTDLEIIKIIRLYERQAEINLIKMKSQSSKIKKGADYICLK